MRSVYLVSVLVLCGVLTGYGQSTSEKVKAGRPDIPGDFLVDVGWSVPLNGPDELKPNIWGSQTVNLYYQEEIRFGSSSFSFHPGIGLGLDRIKFNNGYTLGFAAGPKGDTLKLVPGPAGIRKSQLVTNYLDVPLEIRFTALPDDPEHSFKLAVGFRGGFLMNGFTKLKYKDDDGLHRVKDSRDYNLNLFRYGPYARIWVGNFNFFGYSNMSSLFDSGNGPNKADKDITTVTFGLSISGF